MWKVWIAYEKFELHMKITYENIILHLTYENNRYPHI